MFIGQRHRVAAMEMEARAWDTTANSITLIELLCCFTSLLEHYQAFTTTDLLQYTKNTVLVSFPPKKPLPTYLVDNQNQIFVKLQSCSFYLRDAAVQRGLE